MKNNSTYEQQLEEHGRIVYTNTGYSMLPLLRQNRDLMIIEKRGKGRCRKYDAVLYRTPHGRYIMHRILKVGKDDYTICGDNLWKREKHVPDDWIIGILTGVIRDGNELSVEDWRYKLYVHLWCDFFPIRAAVLWCIWMLKRIWGKLMK